MARKWFSCTVFPFGQKNHKFISQLQEGIKAGLYFCDNFVVLVVYDKLGVVNTVEEDMEGN